MAKARGISVVVSGNTAPLRKSLRDAGQELSAFGKAQAKWSQASSLAYGIVGTAAAQFAISSVKAALEDQQSQALLAKQLQATTGARSVQIAGVEDYIEKTMLATNVTDDQLRPALAQLVRVTGNAAQAQRLLTLAADVSVGSGRELGSVVVALGKAYQGSTGALSKLGIQIDAAAYSTKGFAAVTDQLETQFGGQAAAAADTLAGRVQNLGVRFDEFKEQLGTQLLPVLEDVLDSFDKAGKLADETGNPFAALFSVTADLAGGINNLIFESTGLNAIGDELAITWNELYETITGTREVKDAERNLAALGTRLEMLSGILVQDQKNWEAYRGQIVETDDAYQDLMDSIAKSKFDLVVDSMKKQLDALKDIEQENKDAAEAAAERAAATAAATALTEKQKRVAYRETAKTLRETLTEALKDARQELQDAKDDADEFGRSFAYSFGVSLSGAYSDAKDSENAYTDALSARKDAYDALDVAKQGSDLGAYLKAVQDVATAEQAVTDAQAKRVTPVAAFADQIAAAKTFGANLKTLVGQGNLSKAALQQLLDLGPVAGAEVTKALLEGTAGFTAGGLSQDLADLAGVQGGLAAQITSSLAPTGAITSAQGMVDALSSASIGAPGVGQGFTINIVSGVGDPVEIGRQVKNVLTQYDTRAGKLTVQGPKKKAKR